MNYNNDEQYQKAFAKSIRFLSFRPRSEKEIKDYLTKKRFSEKIIFPIIERLKELKYLDDLDFAKRWVEVRQKEKNRSKFAIRLELKQKGIDIDIIEKVIGKAQEDFKTAKDIFEKKKERLSHLSNDEFEKKIIPFLQRKGFSWDIIQKLLKEE